jgi:hypothetical protein
MGNGGWTADPAFLLVPPEATELDPRIFIGGADDDPTLSQLDQTEGIVFYFGEQRAFVISVEQEGPPGSPEDIGRLHIWGYCGFPSQLHQIVNVDYDIPHNLVTWNFNPDSPDISMQSVIDIKADVVGIGGDHEPADSEPQFQDAYLFGKSFNRGAKAFGSSIASSAAIGTTTETVVLTSGSFTYRAGRAYRAEVTGLITASAAGGDAQFRLRKGSTTAGLLLSSTGATACPIAGRNYQASGWTYFTVPGVLDVTTTLNYALTATGGNITQFASATTPRLMTVYDVGAASDYPNAPALS